MKIAVDGPAGSGKSTVAKLIADKLHFLYIDTGAMYRSITYAVLSNNISPNDSKAVIDFLKDLNIVFKKENNSIKIFINDNDITDKIRNKEIDENVSVISAIPEVRELLIKYQRELSKDYNVILDGRDIGTVVFPDADFKFYIDASVEVRANRRLKDSKNKDALSLDKIKNDIIERDRLDSTRKVGPLKKAADAIYIDTSNLNINEVVDKVLNIILSEK